MASEGLSVAVIGAAGYTGGELCRLLLSHPGVGSIVPTSRGSESFERVHRNLLGSSLQFVDPTAVFSDAGNFDVIFFCTPSGEAMRAAGSCLQAGAKVIDLSADFRFPDAESYRAAHGLAHTAPDLLKEAVYGISELFRDKVKHARLVANPGCYVITAVLGLAPILQAGYVDVDSVIHISAVNGTTGAGSSPRREVLHSEVFGTMLPYSMEGHRHGPELEHVLSQLSRAPLTVDLNTAHGNFARGIYIQSSVLIRPEDRRSVSRDSLLSLYRDAYGPGHDIERFVILNDFDKEGKKNHKEYDVYPNISSVRGSNYCHIGLDYDPARGIAKMMSVTDNLVKGAAGSAIQNMNLMFDLEESTGLRQYGS